MSEFFRDWFVWCYLYLQHVFVMMYWVTIPGLLVCGYLSVRYREIIQEKLLMPGEGLQKVFYAIALGMTSPANRRDSLETTSALITQGIPRVAALAFFVSSQSLGLYLLLLFTVLIGLEFGLGVFLGGLVMILLTAIITSFLPSLRSASKVSSRTSKSELPEALPITWRSLLLSSRGWWAVIEDIGRFFRALWVASLGGLLLGGLILAADMHRAWSLPFWLGDEGPSPATASALLGPFLSFVSFSSPLGNLIVGSSIWKTWTFAYPGIISFVLAASLHPLSLRSVAERFGPGAGKYIIAILYLSAAIGGLAVIGLFSLLGLEVTHVPWFEPLVKKIIMMLPFTMLGTGGMSIMGKMTGM